MKKHTQHRRKRRRIIAVFLIAVMLPGLIFAYLGFRSINQEERWQKQLVTRNLRTSLQAGIAEIEQNVQSHMRAILDSLELQTFDPQGFSPGRLQRFSLRNPLVSGIFVLGQSRRLLYPRGFRERLIPSNLWKKVESESLRRHLELGEQFEARGRHNDAMDEYTRGLRERTSRRVHLALLVRIARCRSKMGDLEDAQRDYRRVIVEDRGQFYGEELPYRLLASYQLAALAEQTGRQASAFDLLTDLYDDMLNNFNRFERSQFQFHLNKVKNGLQDLSGHVRDGARAEPDSVARREDELWNEVDRRGFLQVHLLPEIARRQGTTNSGLQIVTVNADEGVFHFAYNASGIQNSRIKIVGLELERQGLRAIIADEAGKLAIGDRAQMVLMDHSGKVVSSSGLSDREPVMEESLVRLAATLPGYRIAMVGIDGHPIEDIASRSLTLYYILLAVITVVIVLGIAFIFHDVSREQELSRMKSDFISNVTHEIKTPIATIGTLAGNVNEGWVNDPVRQREYFRLIARESERLGHLVENTLDFSRVESGRKTYRMRVISPGDLIEKTLDRFRTLTDGQEVTVKCEIASDLPRTRLDPEAIGQALLNLLDNAVKYSGGEKVVELRTRVERDHLVISVADRGIGFDKSQMDKIFQKFYRIESESGRNVAGSGIGLTLVMEIVEAHGGRVEVESQPGKGSTFTMILPITSEEMNAADSVD